MELAMMVTMFCSTIISQTSNSSSSGSRWARTKTKTFLESNRQNLFRTVEKSWKNQTVKSQQSSKKNKKCNILTIIPVLGNLNHMYNTPPYLQHLEYVQYSPLSPRSHLLGTSPSSTDLEVQSPLLLSFCLSCIIAHSQHIISAIHSRQKICPPQE